MRIENKQIGEVLNFEYDPAAGNITGDDAKRIRSIIRFSQGQAVLPGSGPVLAAPDPEHSPRSLALILASFDYELPKELSKHLPPFDEEMDEGAIF